MSTGRQPGRVVLTGGMSTGGGRRRPPLTSTSTSTSSTTTTSTSTGTSSSTSTDNQPGGGVAGPVATAAGTMPKVLSHPVIEYLKKHLHIFFMQVDSQWVDLILSQEKKIKYAPWFVAAIGKILLLRENQKKAKKGNAQKGTLSPGGFCRAALVLGHPFQKDKDPVKFLESWGCRNYKNGFPIQFILLFPPFF